jgi:DNA-binding transcriptional ArsR family regulator
MHAEVFQTLADPTRLRIVEVLRGGELPVNDIVARVDIHQSGVSRHLRILSEAGFVRSRPAGLQRFYALRPEPFHELDAWVARYRSLWESRLDRFAAALARRAKAASPPQPLAGGAGPFEGPAREKRQQKDKDQKDKKGRST